MRTQDSRRRIVDFARRLEFVFWYWDFPCEMEFDDTKDESPGRQAFLSEVEEFWRGIERRELYDRAESVRKLLYVMSSIASDYSLNAWRDAIAKLREIAWNKRIAITKHVTQDLYVAFDFLGVTNNNDGMLVFYDTREQLGLASIRQGSRVSMQDDLILVDDLPHGIFNLTALLI